MFLLKYNIEIPADYDLTMTVKEFYTAENELVLNLVPK
jgi:hypothetical protein